MRKREKGNHLKFKRTDQSPVLRRVFCRVFPGIRDSDLQRQPLTLNMLRIHANIARRQFPETLSEEGFEAANSRTINELARFVADKRLDKERTPDNGE